jgi:hypothetical protein
MVRHGSYRSKAPSADAMQRRDSSKGPQDRTSTSRQAQDSRLVRHHLSRPTRQRKPGNVLLEVIGVGIPTTGTMCRRRMASFCVGPRSNGLGLARKHRPLCLRPLVLAMMLETWVMPSAIPPVDDLLAWRPARETAILTTATRLVNQKTRIRWRHYRHLRHCRLFSRHQPLRWRRNREL